MAFKEKKKVVHLDQEAWEKKVRKRRILIAALLAGILVGLAASYIIRKVLPDKARSKAYSEAEAAIAAGNIAEGFGRSEKIRPERRVYNADTRHFCEFPRPLARRAGRYYKEARSRLDRGVLICIWE